MKREDLPQIKVSFLFLAVVTVFLLTDRQGITAQALAASVLHELGHLTALALFGALPREIGFYAHGIRFTLSHAHPLSYGQEAATLLAGPGINLVFAALFFLFAKGRQRLLWAGMAHLCTGGFNLLPAGMLDGGRLLSLLARRTQGRGFFWLVRGLSVVCSGGLAAAGVLFLFSGGGNFTLLLTALVLTAEALSQNCD